MSIVLGEIDGDLLPDTERRARLRLAVDGWLHRHELMLRALGRSADLTCRVAGRRFAGYECFDCDFESTSGARHCITVSVCYANAFEDEDAQVVDAVSALTLIGMLLARLEIRPELLAR